MFCKIKEWPPQRALWVGWKIPFTLKLYLMFLCPWFLILLLCGNLHNISMIRFLMTETSKPLVYAFVTSKIDYCNSLLYGAPKDLLHGLQHVLNSTARIVYQSKKYDHIMPLLVGLHWPHTEQRINFKIVLITIKVLHNQAPTYLVDILIIIPQGYFVHMLKTCLGIKHKILKLIVGILLLWLSYHFGMFFPNLSKPRLKKHLSLSAYYSHYTKNFELKWIVKFFTTFKCEHLNHHMGPLWKLQVKGNLFVCPHIWTVANLTYGLLSH